MMADGWTPWRGGGLQGRGEETPKAPFGWLDMEALEISQPQNGLPDPRDPCIDLIQKHISQIKDVQGPQGELQL